MTGTVWSFRPDALLPPAHRIRVSFLQGGPGRLGVVDLEGRALPGLRVFTIGPIGVVNDETPPSYEHVSPRDGSAGIGTNARFTLRYDEPVNRLTAASSLRLENVETREVVPCSIRFATSERTVFVVPHAPLAPDSAYTLIQDGTTDRSGNPAPGPDTRFRTGPGPDFEPPRVVLASPTAGATNVPANGIARIRFDESIDLGDAGEGAFRIDGPGGVAVDRELRYDDEFAAWELVPSALLSPDTLFTLRALAIVGGQRIVDSAGNAFGGFQSTFRTGVLGADTSAPTIVAICPGDGDGGVPTNVKWTIVVSERPDPFSVAMANIELWHAASGESVAGNIAVDGETITFAPRTLLARATAYTLSVAEVRDLAGNVLADPAEVTITTGPGADFAGPRRVTTTPLQGESGVPTTVAVTLTFDEPLSPCAVGPASVRIEGVESDVSLSADRHRVTIAPRVPLEPGRSYSVTSEVADLAGNVDSFQTLSFSTAP